MQQDNRKSFIVNASLQRMIALSMGGCAAAGGLITFAAQFFFFQSFRSAGVELGLSPEHLFFRFVDQQAQLMGWIVFGLIFVFAATFAYLGYKLSHRIAGPLHRLETEMNRFSAGEKVEPLIFRDNDFLQPLAQSFNKISKSAHQK